jgi:hypothetical protein
LGWQVRVRERIVQREGRPLGAWAAGLSTLYQRALQAGDKWVAGCHRAIALHTIGTFHQLGTFTQEEHVSLAEFAIRPEDGQITPEGGAVIRTRERAKQWKTEETSHPEWSAAIWALSRLRVVKALLQVPKQTIVAVEGDAIYLTVPPVSGLPAWKDDGGLGRLRLKGFRPGPLVAPLDLEGVRALGKAAERG